jgi:Family of unknown function (DUF6632)
MRRERALKIVLALVGLLFTAGTYPLTDSLRHANRAEIGPMMLSLYITLGIFLLLATRNPSANRSLIAFTAWSSFAHGSVMTVQAFRDEGERGHLLLGVVLFGIIGVALLALAPAKQPAEMASTAVA